MQRRTVSAYLEDESKAGSRVSPTPLGNDMKRDRTSGPDLKGNYDLDDESNHPVMPDLLLSKVPSGLQEKQESNRKFNKSGLDNNKPLNEDIPVDKKPRKAKRRLPKNNHMRYSQILDGLSQPI